MARKRKAAAGRRQAAGQSGRRSAALSFIMYKIGILRRLIERYSNPTIPERTGTTVAEWRVLTHLYAAPAMTATELSARLSADKAEVSRACANLIAKGHVSRRPDKSDGRSMLLAISRSGVALHDRILPLRRALEEELGAVLHDREAKALHRAMDQLIDYLAAKVAAGITLPHEVQPSPSPRGRAGRARAAPRSR